MTYVLHLFHNHFWWALGVVGLVALFYGIFEVEDLLKGKIRPRPIIAKVQAWVGGVMLSLGLVLFLFGGKIGPHPYIAGRYFYEVSSADAAYSHLGLCNVTQAGDRLHFRGTRRFMTTRNADASLRTVPVSYGWHSTWAECCCDEMIRFDYTIVVQEKLYAGHVQVSRSTDESEYLIGTYSLMPPVPPDCPMPTTGQIRFWIPQDGQRLEDFLPKPK